MTDWDEIMRDTTRVGSWRAPGPWLEVGVSGLCIVKVRLGGSDMMPFGALGSEIAVA